MNPFGGLLAGAAADVLGCSLFIFCNSYNKFVGQFVNIFQTFSVLMYQCSTELKRSDGTVNPWIVIPLSVRGTI